MSLGHDLAPHLPFLRRYARALTGSQAHGDAYVRATLEAIVASPQDFPRDVDPRLALYRTFHVIWSTASTESDGMPAEDNTGAAAGRLKEIPPLSRQALLLTAMEGFTSEDVGYVMGGVSAVEVDALVAEAHAEIERQTRANVLIIEDEPIIMMDLEATVRDLGHRVTGVAVTGEEAVQKARELSPDLILADIQLADDSSGIDAVKTILSERRVPVIFITAFPERLIGNSVEPSYLISKPFDRSTVKAAIAQALFFGSMAPAEAQAIQPPPVERRQSRSVEQIPNDLVRPRLSPVDAKVVDSQIRYVGITRAEAASSDRIVNAVRKMHLATALRLAGGLTGSNVGPGFDARFKAIHLLLKRSLSSERALQLAIHVRGLEGMMDAVAERLDEVTAADIAVFVADLIDLLNQLPAYRRFSEEARSVIDATGEGVRVAATVAAVLEQQADELVDPPLKNAVREVRTSAEEQPEALTALALIRTVGNAFRAVGRFFNERLAKLKQKATDTFDETAGKALGKSLAYLLVGTPIGAALTTLYSLYPAEFGFVTQLIRAAKALF